MGFSEAEGEALNATVRGIIERAISSLQAIGLTYDGALAGLMIQAAIRMDDAAEVRRILKSIEDLIDTGDDDDDEPSSATVIPFVPW